MRGSSQRDERVALLAMAAVLAITVFWWTFALWPVPGETPDWLDRARAVCFNAGPDGMPDGSGWILLIGQPLGMFGFLWVVWPRPLVGGLRGLSRTLGGRLTLGATALLVVAGLAGAGLRVASAADARAPVTLPPPAAPEDHPRLDREPAELGLKDHRGEAVTVEDLRGAPALVTFAFAHCDDICPLVVENARLARDEAWGREGASLVVVTLDPWRDTPARLPDIAGRWGLDGPRDHLLSGPVDEVQAVLDAWGVPRDRSTRTGDVVHPALTYLLDPTGTLVFSTLGHRETLVGLGRRLLEE